jgi:hydrogenase maturation protease
MRIICCGNPDRGDDGAGILVAERLRRLGIEAETVGGDALTLLEAWRGAESALVVDAVVTGEPVGTVHVWEGQIPPAANPGTSSHGFGVAEAIRLAAALHQLPPQLRIIGIEAARFEVGSEPSFQVQQAVDKLVAQITARISDGATRRDSRRVPALPESPELAADHR